MAVELISLKCPNCGASLTVEEGHKSIFCNYCGEKLLIHDSNEYTVNIHDEAEIKKAETDQIINLKKMEFAEKATQDHKNTRKLKIIISLAFAGVGIFMILIGFALGALTGDPESYEMLEILGLYPLIAAGFIAMISLAGNKDDDDNPYDDRIRVPEISNYKSKSYQAIGEIFKSAGFTNVSTVGLGDLTVGILKKPGQVDSITVNGKDIFDASGKKYQKDAKVIISYHSQAI